MTKTERSPVRDYGAAAILATLVLVGLIPWMGVLWGDAPAYSAELGAVVSVTAFFLLLLTLWEMRPTTPANPPPPRDPE